MNMTQVSRIRSDKVLVLKFLAVVHLAKRKLSTGARRRQNLHDYSRTPTNPTKGDSSITAHRQKSMKGSERRYLQRLVGAAGLGKGVDEGVHGLNVGRYPRLQHLFEKSLGHADATTGASPAQGAERGDNNRTRVHL